MTKRPRVNTSPVASRYAAPDERVIEFSSEVGGGLINLYERNGKLHVQIYNCDPSVRVMVNPDNLVTGTE